MKNDALILYKLIVLYILDRVKFPLTKTQVCDFILEHDYTTYLTLQQAISELDEAGFINSNTVLNRTFLEISSEGRNTLSYFNNRLSDDIKGDINTYLRAHELELRNEVSILADYDKLTNGEYQASLQAKDKDVSLVEIKLCVPTEEIAARICEQWSHKNEQIYQYIMENLF